MSQIRKLFVHSSHYLAGQAFLMAAGFVSFPIFTRIFSVSDYGIFCLINSSIFIIQTFVAHGTNHSIVRFYPEYKHSNKINILHSTIVLLGVPLALALTGFILVIIRYLPDHLYNQYARSLFYVVTIIIFVKTFNSLFITVLRADQRTKFYNIVIILNRYGNIVFSLVFILFVIKDLSGFYIGQLLSELILATVLLHNFLAKYNLRLKYISLEVFRSSLQFGLPLTSSQVLHVLLSYADRYLIQFYIGSGPLGLYSAGYNLSTYLTDFVKLPINKAIDPILLSICTSEGYQKAKQFLTKALTYYLLLVLPVAFGFIAIRRDFISMLATPKFAEASSIIPYVITANMLYALQAVLNAGIIVYKKTNILFMLRLLGLLFNIILNIFFIPRYGIVGAALATLISYIVYTFCITIYSFRLLPFPVEYRRIALYFLLSVLMFLVVHYTPLMSTFLGLTIKIILGASFYCTCVLTFDTELRSQFVRRFKDSALGWTRPA